MKFIVGNLIILNAVISDVFSSITNQMIVYSLYFAMIYYLLDDSNVYIKDFVETILWFLTSFLIVFLWSSFNFDLVFLEQFISPTGNSVVIFYFYYIFKSTFYFYVIALYFFYMYFDIWVGFKAVFTVYFLLEIWLKLIFCSTLNDVII